MRSTPMELHRQFSSGQLEPPRLDELLACLFPADGMAVAATALGALAVAGVIAATPTEPPAQHCISCARKRHLSGKAARSQSGHRSSATGGGRAHVSSDDDDTDTDSVAKARGARTSLLGFASRLPPTCTYVSCVTPSRVAMLAAIIHTTVSPSTYFPSLVGAEAPSQGSSYPLTLVRSGLAYFVLAFLAWSRAARPSSRVATLATVCGCSTASSQMESRPHQTIVTPKLSSIHAALAPGAASQPVGSRTWRRSSRVRHHPDHNCFRCFCRGRGWRRCVRKGRRWKQACISIASAIHQPDSLTTLLFVAAFAHFAISMFPTGPIASFGRQASIPVAITLSVYFPALIFLLSGVIQALAAKATRTQLQESGETLRAFTGYISHSTRVPLNAAQLAADELNEDITLAVEDGLMNPDAAAMLEILQNSLGAARAVLDDVLTLESSLQRGAGSLRPTWVRGRDLLGPVRSMFEGGGTSLGSSAAGAKDLDIIDAVSMAGVDVFVDHARLTQVRAWLWWCGNDSGMCSSARGGFPRPHSSDSMRAGVAQSQVLAAPFCALCDCRFVQILPPTRSSLVLADPPDLSSISNAASPAAQLARRSLPRLDTLRRLAPFGTGGPWNAVGQQRHRATREPPSCPILLPTQDPPARSQRASRFQRSWYLHSTSWFARWGAAPLQWFRPRPGRLHQSGTTQRGGRRHPGAPLRWGTRRLAGACGLDRLPCTPALQLQEAVGSRWYLWCRPWTRGSAWKRRTVSTCFAHSPKSMRAWEPRASERGLDWLYVPPSRTPWVEQSAMPPTP